MTRFKALLPHLQSLTDGTGPASYLNAGLAQISPGGEEEARIFGKLTPDGPALAQMDVERRARFASVSKAVTARVVTELAYAGTLDLDADILTYLDWPDPPKHLYQTSVTVRSLLCHLSGLTDRAGYYVDPPETLTGFISTHADDVLAQDPHTPFFRYANLNYVLLGAVLEAATGQRFDHLARRYVLTPAGIKGGFNWAGVPVTDRMHRLPLYQRFGSSLTLQSDGDDADWAADIIWRDGKGFDFPSYETGRDISLLSPHAGLRMSVREAARLARFLATPTPASQMQRRPQWVFTSGRPNGEDCDGLFTKFALGLTLYQNHPRIKTHLIGHAGHALGFTGGVWHNVETDTSWAYFLTGSADMTEGLDEEVFYPDEEVAILNSF